MKVRDILAELSHYELDDAISYALWVKSDVELLIKALNADACDKMVYDVSAEEVTTILNNIHESQSREDGITIQSVYDAYFYIQTQKEEGNAT